MAKFKEGDIIDVPMRVLGTFDNNDYAFPDCYSLEGLDSSPNRIGIYTHFVDDHARLSNYKKAQSAPAEAPIAVGDVVRLRSGSPPFVVSALHEHGHATLLTWASSVTDFAEHVVPILCLKKDSD